MENENLNRWIRRIMNVLSAIGFMFLVTWIITIFATPLPVQFVFEKLCKNSICDENIDLIQAAVQLGRLDFVSMTLGIIGAGVAMAALFGVLVVRETAIRVAEKESHDVSCEIAERVTKEIAEREMANFFAQLGKDMDQENDEGEIETDFTKDINHSEEGDEL